MRDNLDSRDGGISSAWMWAIAAVVVLGLVFMWAPWSNNHSASNSGAGTTVGSSNGRAPAPAAPTTTSPAAPAPSTAK
jgi:hypothetical protein